MALSDPDPAEPPLSKKQGEIMRRRVRYRSDSGRRRRLAVHARRGRVCLVFDDGSWCELRGLEVGRVRAALKEKAILSANEPDLDELA